MGAMVTRLRKREKYVGYIKNVYDNTFSSSVSKVVSQDNSLNCSLCKFRSEKKLEVSSLITKNGSEEICKQNVLHQRNRTALSAFHLLIVFSKLLKAFGLLGMFRLS